MQPDTLFFALGSAFGGLAVALGAFGTHALRARLSPEMLANFETGVRYQFYHALACFAVALAAGRWMGSNLAPLTVVAGTLFVAGMILFCGTLYVIALGGPRGLGMIAPIGGLLLVAGWLCLLMLPVLPARPANVAPATSPVIVATVTPGPVAPTVASP